MAGLLTARAPGPRPESGPGGRAPELFPPDPEEAGAFQRGPAGSPKALVRTTGPTRYWVVTRIRIPDAGGSRSGPGLLVVMSPNLSGGGLFFDYRPWLLAGGSVLLLSVLFWFPFVRGITRSISQLTQATEQIAEGRFDVRVSARRQDELGSLALSVNRMAERLAGFVTGQKRFLGDIAHELCAPLARLQMVIGILEQRADPANRGVVADAGDEVKEMSALVNELLSFSKAGLKPQDVRCEPVALAELAARVVERENGAGRVKVLVADGLSAMAEPELLSRALANLVRNAIRYAGDSGPITLSAERQGGEICLRVADSGPGVPEAALARIFDPFYRVEASRSRETGGVGLGLAIVKTCIEACRGRVIARNRKPSGLEVDLILPAEL